MIKFNLTLKAAQEPVSAGRFWRLLRIIATLAFGYAGETGVSEARNGFSFGMADWFCILKEILMSEAGGAAGQGSGIDACFADSLEHQEGSMQGTCLASPGIDACFQHPSRAE